MNSSVKDQLLKIKLKHEAEKNHPVEEQNSPEDIIKLALAGGQSILDTHDKRSREDSLSRISRSVNGRGGQPPTSTAGDFMPASEAPVDVNKIQSFVQQMAVGQYGWSGQEWNALFDLINRESGWNPHADNPSSSAYGLFQFIDSTRANYGISTNSPLEDQVRAGLQYIADRYGSPSRALQHWLSRQPINGEDVGHWY